MDEETGNPWDYSGNLYVATNTGCEYVDGNFNNALRFNGSESDNVNLGDVLDLGTGDRTFIFWLNTETVNVRLIDKSSWVTNWLNYMIILDANGKIQGRIGTGSASITVQGTTVVNDGSYHFIAVVFDRDGNGFVKVDNGTAEGTINISGYSGNDLNNAVNLRLGSTPGGGSYYTGDLDQVIFIDKALVVADLDFLNENITAYYEEITAEESFNVSFVFALIAFILAVASLATNRK